MLKVKGLSKDVGEDIAKRKVGQINQNNGYLEKINKNFFYINLLLCKLFFSKGPGWESGWLTRLTLYGYTMLALEIMGYQANNLVPIIRHFITTFWSINGSTEPPKHHKLFH